MIEIVSATQATVQHLRDLIIAGELKPGQTINEAALANSIGLSRPPVREALRILETESLVVNIPRKYTRISDVSHRDFEKVFQTKEMIECYVLDLLKRKGVNDLSFLNTALAGSKDCKIEKGEDPQKVLGCLKTLADFHIRLVALAENSHMLKLYRSILGNVCRYQFMYFSRTLAQPPIEAHCQIVKNIKNGDFDQAKKVLSVPRVHYVLPA
jgi:DNA-binding GntR family transcriptional regulator